MWRKQLDIAHSFLVFFFPLPLFPSFFSPAARAEPKKKNQARESRRANFFLAARGEEGEGEGHTRAAVLCKSRHRNHRCHSITRTFDSSVWSKNKVHLTRCCFNETASRDNQRRRVILGDRGGQDRDARHAAKSRYFHPDYAVACCLYLTILRVFSFFCLIRSTLWKICDRKWGHLHFLHGFCNEWKKNVYKKEFAFFREY